MEKLTATNINIRFDKIVVNYVEQIKKYINDYINKDDLVNIWVYSYNVEIEFNIGNYNVSNLIDGLSKYISALINEKKYQGAKIKNYNVNILKQMLENGGIELEEAKSD